MASKEVAHDCLGHNCGTGQCALLAIGSNWAGMLGLLRHLSGDAARSYSPIPLIGGELGAAALTAAPVEAVNRWFWLPLLRPSGTGLYLLVLVCLCLSVDRFVRANFQQRKSKFLQMA